MVIPPDRALGGRVVDGTHLVVDESLFTKDTVPVGKTGGDKELFMRCPIELDPLPLAKGRRVGAKIDRHIENFP
jgi:hypothetical protein